MAKKLTIYIFEDNGGGLTMQTYNFCHYYNNPISLAQDYYALNDLGSTTQGWEGNEQSNRFIPYESDRFDNRTWNQAQILNAYLTEHVEDIRSGGAFKEFITELKILGTNKRQERIDAADEKIRDQIINAREYARL